MSLRLDATERNALVSERIRLDRLEAGLCGTVCGVEAGQEEVERLLALGVCSGRRVMIVKQGDPLILRVLGSRVGLSARLAALVHVVTCPAVTGETPSPRSR